MSAKRETHASAKPEGAKQQSSPAGLTGRSAERTCKLVSDKKGSYNGGGQIPEVIFSMVQNFLFSKTWLDNEGGLTPGGLIPEVPL